MFSFSGSSRKPNRSLQGHRNRSLEAHLHARLVRFTSSAYFFKCTHRIVDLHLRVLPGSLKVPFSGQLCGCDEFARSRDHRGSTFPQGGPKLYDTWELYVREETALADLDKTSTIQHSVSPMGFNYVEKISLTGRTHRFDFFLEIPKCEGRTSPAITDVPPYLMKLTETEDRLFYCRSKLYTSSARSNQITLH